MNSCKNCTITLTENDLYCNHCGAKVIRKRITLKNILNDFSTQFLNYDNTLLQTFWGLIIRPGAVIGSYISGTRKRYMNVLSYFAVAITLSGLQIYILNKYFPEALDISSITAKGTEDFAKRNMEFINEYQSLVMMLYVPLYALLARIVFFNIKKYNYAELIVVFMYILAQLSIIGAVLSVIFAATGITLGTVSLILLVLQVIYSAYCLKQLYALGLSGILLRTLLFMGLLAVFFVAFSIVVGVIMYLTGDIENFR